MLRSHMTVLLLVILSAGIMVAGPLTKRANSAEDFSARRDHNWHQWRGPSATGFTANANPPTKWDEKKNVRWKIALPGEGSSTPIVWENKVFVLCAIETNRESPTPAKKDERAKTNPPANLFQYVVLCLDRQSGKTLWRRVACEAAPHEGRHRTNSFASFSPTTDGRRLYVSFGSRGVYCYNLKGMLLWKRNLGEMRTRYGWGEATSPVIHGDALIVNWDHEDQSFIVVLDAKTGKTRWQVDRDEPTSWSTPLVTEFGGRAQVVVNATRRIRSYDLKTGKLLWSCGGQTTNVIPSPVRYKDYVICMSSYGVSTAVAIPLNTQGDITEKQKVRWSYSRGTPYVPSPLLVGRRLYFTQRTTAVLTCLDAETGKLVFGPKRLPELSSLYASPASAAGRIYIAGRSGNMVVIRDGPKFEVLATNHLDDRFDASPVLVGRQLFLRGARNLYCIEEE